ncbi:MAG TPA: hypothetical protein VMU04_06330 [Candidatus Acidoferrum sp.]|nr:hypothetical protein [Candidatus Acidoferrum sp.]
MNTLLSASAPKRLALLCVTLSAGLLSLAADTRTNSPKGLSLSTTVTNVYVEPEVPKSMFLIPTTPQQGRDPFYPNSTRLFASVVVNAAKPASAVQVELRLKALSGVPNHRLAMINNHTFESGEEGEVTTPTGHARIRCLQINEDSAVVQVGGEQRILRLRPGI